ncbi:MAG: class I SAM-dependent methyltransferase [Candidatus Promineifilaceae bacterium]
MGFTIRYSGTFSYVQTHWPTYLIGYGGGVAFILSALWVSFDQGWFAFVNLALAGSLILIYFFVASLWAAHKLYDGGDIIDAVFELGDLDPGQTMIYLDLGLRATGIALSRRLTTGRVIIVDIYNPQLAPARWLSRATQRAERQVDDPRIIWKGGSIDLFPLPDQTMPAVILIMSASEFWQEGDRMQLFEEIYRVLSPGGMLLMVERVRTSTNWMVLGPATLRMRNASYWRSAFERVGFKTTRESEQNDMLHFFRAERVL